MGKHNVPIEVKRLFAIRAMRWCRDYMGVNNRRKSLPKISVRINFRKDETERFIKGIYYSYENRIIIYDLNCKTIEDIVSTVIHEYTHYLQFWPWYTRYKNLYKYENNPYEVQARNMENIAPGLIELTRSDLWESYLRKNRKLASIHRKINGMVIIEG